MGEHTLITVTLMLIAAFTVFEICAKLFRILWQKINRQIDAKHQEKINVIYDRSNSHN